MPITPNYGWTTPVVNGDFGAWGGILNAAFVEIDADVKALADLVTANALNVAKTNVNNAFSGTQLFANLSASGAVTVAGGVTANTIASSAPGFPNEVLNRMAGFTGGADALLGGLTLALEAFPSATAGNRFAQFVVGDALGLRALHLRSSKLFVGTNTSPAFVATEAAAFEGEVALLSGGRALRLGPGAADATYMELFARTATPTVRSGYIGFGAAAATGLDVTCDIGAVRLQSSVGSLIVGSAATFNIPVTATQFNGSGIGLTGITQNQITSLVSDLAGKAAVVHTHAQSEITNLVSDLAGKSAISHVHAGEDITSGTVAWARIANPPSISFAAGGSTAFAFASSMIDAADGAAAPAINRPGALTSYSWSWVEVTPIGAATQSWIPVLSGVNV